MQRHSKQLEIPVHLRLFYYALSIIALILVGTLGYMSIEHWDITDSLFMTVTTLATVGYGEVNPLSEIGRIYTIVLIIVGVGWFLYIISDIVQITVNTDPHSIFAQRAMKKQIEHLKDHQIVCGFGRTGQEVAFHFSQNNVPFVVIEQDEEMTKRAEQQGYLVLRGDASTDEILLEAQITNAAGIVCALPDDSANTFISLSAKGLKEDIKIVSRSANPGSEGKLKRAGANVVVSPYVICGRKLATAITHPLVIEFLDVVMHSPAYDLRIEQITIHKGSKLVGMSLKDSNIKQIAGAMIIAISRQGALLTNPSPDHHFQEGDIVVTIGSDEQLKRLADLACQKY